MPQLPIEALTLSVEHGSELPVDGSSVFAFIAPSGGLRLHSMAALVDRRPFIFVGNGHICTYYDETTGMDVVVPTGWAALGLSI